MEIVTKRDMADARKLVDGTEIEFDLDDLVHDIAQAIANGRRPEHHVLEAETYDAHDS